MLAYLQVLYTNPHGEAGGHNIEHSLSGLRAIPHQLQQGRGRGVAKALQLTCSRVMPIQTARPVGITLTMAFQGWP